MSSLNGVGQTENENDNITSRDSEFKAPLREKNCLLTDNNIISTCEETGNNSVNFVLSSLYLFYF